MTFFIHTYNCGRTSIKDKKRAVVNSVNQKQHSVNSKYSLIQLD